MAKRTTVASWHLTALMAVLIAGILLRIVYVYWTDAGTRGHDVWSHVEYVQYVAQHHSLPDPHGSSVFYHPPLYYLLSAPAYAWGTAAGWEESSRLIAVQIVSLLLSIITFAIIVYTGIRLFPLKKEYLPHILFCAILASYPALVFFTARINNDALYQVFAFGTFTLILLYWQAAKQLHWYLCWLALGFGLLTKTNVVLLAPLAVFCMIFMRGLNIKQKAIHCTLGVMLMMATGGWFHAIRYFEEDNARTTLIGNVEILTNFVENSPRSMLTFNPLRIIGTPYNDPFSPEPRMQHFWEYLFRSGLLGEFNFGDNRVTLARLMLGAQLMLLPLAAYAAWANRKRFWVDLPMWGLAVLIPASHAVFRIYYPYSSAQDFRYSILLVLPIAYFAVVGLGKDPGWMQYLRIFTVVALVGSTTLFLLDLYPR